MALDEQSRLRPLPALTHPDVRIAIVVARFHEDLTGAMLASATKELVRAGVKPENVLVAWAPGSFELPLLAERATQTNVDAVIALGVVIQGETTHDHWVAHGAVSGLMQVALETGKPIHLGVLTCATMEQARARALPPELGGKEDKGREVARAALETLAALDSVARWDRKR